MASVLSICRLCLKSSTEEQFRSISMINQEELIIILPEIDVHTVQSPQICTNCVNSLSEAYSFKSSCLATEKRIRDYADTYGENIDLSKLLISEVQFEVKPDPDKLDIKGRFTLTSTVDIKEEKVETSFENSTNGSVKLFCQICFKLFKTKRALTFHKKSHSRRYQCPSCLKIFIMSDTLRKHIRRIHPEFKRNTLSEIKCCQYGIKIANCNKCGKDACKCSERSKLRYKCKTCGKFIYLLKRHQKILESPIHLCTVCNKTFKTKFTLQKHINIDHFEKRELIKYICELCDLEFLKRPEYLEHKKESHPTDGKMYTCKICDKSFNLKANHAIHMRIHTGERPYKCNDCGQTFSQLGSMNVHKKAKHSNVKPFECQYCDKSFALKGGWSRHLERVHKVGGTEKKFVCSYCQKAFHVQSELSGHMLWHTGERNFICDICNKGFVNNSSLKKHKTVHVEKLHVCSTCGKSFSKKCRLNSHRKEHHAHSEVQSVVEVKLEPNNSETDCENDS